MNVPVGLGDRFQTARNVAVVVPVFRAPYDVLRDLVDQCRTAIEGLGYEFEIVLVFDCGSPEALFAVEQLKSSKGVNVILLPQNVGQQAAVLAGLKATQADVCITVDEDGSALTSCIPNLVEVIVDRSSDLALGVAKVRNLSIVRRIGSKSMVLLGLIIFGSSAPSAWSSFRAMNRSVIDLLPDSLPSGGVLGFELFSVARRVSEVPIPAAQMKPHVNLASSYSPSMRLQYWCGAFRRYFFKNLISKLSNRRRVQCRIQRL